RRVPKRGFNNARFRTEYATINLSDLNRFNDGDVITPELLKELGIVKKQLAGIKVLANGNLEKKVTVRAHRFSSKAVTKIEEKGGTAEVI
ncbi:MAG: uL15 family ribosomal protein, partial [Bacilli bacterium]|nr:uL15 family ribosomal protein [Bacilli bacterium]